MPINPDKIHLMERVLTWLDRGARHDEGKGTGFNMNWFRIDNEYVEDYQGKTCGTVCCMAGAVVELNGLRKSELSDISRVSKYLGMTYQESQALFWGESRKYEIDLSKVTAKQAAITLRNFIKTGEIVWDESLYK